MVTVTEPGGGHGGSASVAWQGGIKEATKMGGKRAKEGPKSR